MRMVSTDSRTQCTAGTSIHFAPGTYLHHTRVFQKHNTHIQQTRIAQFMHLVDLFIYISSLGHPGIIFPRQLPVQAFRCDTWFFVVSLISTCFPVGRSSPFFLSLSRSSQRPMYSGWSFLLSKRQGDGSETPFDRCVCFML